MRYGLLVITHGEAPHLEDAISSFRQWAAPPPDALAAVVDGADARVPLVRGPQGWLVAQNPTQEGFGAACRVGWQLARQMTTDLRLDAIFWLENDFILLRPAPITDMYALLVGYPEVAQMALVRQPLNSDEKAAGSVIRGRGYGEIERFRWIEHQAYWTTNPSLILAATFRDFDWPDGDESEGRFGSLLREADRTFGYYGDGYERFVEHLGPLHLGYGY